MGFADDHGSGYHPQYIQGSGESHREYNNPLWAVVIVIVFLVVIFFALFAFRRDGQGTSGIAEIAALGAINSTGNSGNVNTAAFTELNSRLDSIQREVGHNNDLAELRALYTQACSTDMNVTQQAFNVSNLINQSRTDSLLAFKDAALQTANCCCDTNRNIDNVRFQGEKNTCDIIAAGNANTQRIVDKITENEITRLRDELATERLVSSQCNQNAYLVNTLRPYPAPAFVSFNPAVPYAMA